MEEVMCIQDHSKKLVKKGKIYPLLEVKTLSCCGHVIYDVGVHSNDVGLIRCECGGLHYFDSNVHYLSHSLFAKMDYNEAEEAIANLIDETIRREELVPV